MDKTRYSDTPVLQHSNQFVVLRVKHYGAMLIGRARVNQQRFHD